MDSEDFTLLSVPVPKQISSFNYLLVFWVWCYFEVKNDNVNK